MVAKINMVQTNPKRYNKSQNLEFKPNTDNKHKVTNPNTFKKKGSYYVCEKLGHHTTQCRKRAKPKNNGNLPKASLAKGDDIIVVVSQPNR